MCLSSSIPEANLFLHSLILQTSGVSSSFFFSRSAHSLGCLVIMCLVITLLTTQPHHIPSISSHIRHSKVYSLVWTWCLKGNNHRYMILVIVVIMLPVMIHSFSRETRICTVGPFTGLFQLEMDSINVFIHVPLLSKCLVTMRTSMILLFVMHRLSMLVQVTWMSKGTATYRTLEIL